MKKSILLILFASAIFGVFSTNYCEGNSNSVNVVLGRVSIEKQAKKLAEKGDLDGAILLYKQAMQSEYLNSELDKGMSIGALKEIYKWKHEFSKAKEMASWYIKVNPSLDDNYMELEEINALESYSKNQNPNAVKNYISKLKIKKSNFLPPNRYGIGALIYISDILRLYDTIGDYDAGIAFVDEALKYLYSKHPEIEAVSTSVEAERRGAWLGSGKSDPNWRGYDILKEYLLVREAFEQDKAQGTKGRATKALIQSDYFPW